MLYLLRCPLSICLFWNEIFLLGKCRAGLVTLKIGVHIASLTISLFGLYCHVSGFCVTNKTRFWIWWSNLTLTQLVTTIHKSLSDILSSSSDWTLHGNYSDFQLNSPTTPLYSLNSDLPLCSVLLITLLHWSHGKHRLMLSRMRVYWPVT
jgi:hypothetical protein